MTIDDWLRAALADAARRNLDELRPLLETLAAAARVLRQADWDDSPAPAEQFERGPDGEGRSA